MKLFTNGQGEIGTLILAHGAGAGADHPFMEAFATGLAGRGIRVIRFNFPYMEMRLQDGRKRPPDRALKLLDAYRTVIDAVAVEQGPLLIGGKSMGGRIASMIAAEGHDKISGLVCLGYPFHPPGRPEKLRTDHFNDVSVPTLILQGERDPFGGRDLVKGLTLPTNFALHWAPDGNHDLTPRKASGHTKEANWAAAMDTIAVFVRSL